MGSVDWSCLAVQIAITGIAFFLVNVLILYKDVDGKAPHIRRDDHNLYLSLLLAILVGYWATTHVKSDCVSIPYTNDDKEKFNLADDVMNFNTSYNPKYMLAKAISDQIPGNPLGYVQDNVSRGFDTVSNTVSNWFSWLR